MDREIDQSPFLFNPTYWVGGHTVEYKNLSEVCQGGPLVGAIYINGKRISNNRYGGPIVFDDQFIYVPLFSGAKFIVSKIRITDFETCFIGNYRDIIDLKKLENDRLYFYDSIYDNCLKFYDLTAFRISNQDDTPSSFSTQMRLDSNSFLFDQIKEISNNSKVARLTIDGKTIDDYLFGLPFLYNKSQMLIPVFRPRLFRPYFQLALIDLHDLSIKICGDREKLISLISFDNCNEVIYYTDPNLSIKKRLMI